MTSADTDEAARAAQITALRRLGGEARIAQALAMSEQARRISIAGLLDRNPEMSPDEARAIVLKRILGAELYEAAYGSEPH